MTTRANTKKLHTTLGDLIVAIMDAARGFAANEREAYRLTGLIVNRMVLRPVPVTITRRPTGLPRPGRR